MSKTIVSFLVMISLGASAAWAEASPVRVAGSARLRLAIVDAVRSSPAREEMHRAFGASFEQTMSAACGGAVSVKAQVAGANNAAFGLGAGVFDVVLVIGRSLPSDFTMRDFSRLTATLGAGKSETKAFLIYNVIDEGLQKALRASFASALGNGRFLDAFDGGFSRDVLPPPSTKVAGNDE
jgi:hypothetical protein